jgi:hypothetical protein
MNEFDYLTGVAALFNEEKIAVPARGSRATPIPRIRVNRILKGFGGCSLSSVLNTSVISVGG